MARKHGKVKRIPGADPRKEMSGILRNRVSKTNKKEFDNEKRVKELTSRGYGQEAVAGMMGIPEKDVEKMRDHKIEGRNGKPMMTRDGEL